MKKPHILLVDDDHIARMGTSFILKNAGYETSEAFNGHQAFEILKKNPTIDAIFLDLIMPKMSGMAVLQRLRASPTLFNIPVIVLTAQAKHEHVKAALRLGVFEVVHKPIDESLLCNVLKSALRQRNYFSTKSSITTSITLQPSLY